MSDRSQAAELDLVGGALAFDFANTAGGRNSQAPIENLQTHGDLLAWASHAGLLNRTSKAIVADAILREPRLGTRLLATAHDLRDAIYEIGVAFAGGFKPAPSDLVTIKGYYERTVAAATLVPNEHGHYGFDLTTAPPDFAMFGPIAVSVVDILTSVDTSRIKQCPADDCGWLFIDSSKNRSRRWCDMATCGNRMKGRKHRQLRS